MGSRERILVELAKGAKTPKEIIKNTGLAARTISFNLKKMLNLRPAIISKHSSLQDARQCVYFICNEDLLQRILSEIANDPSHTPPVEESVIEGLQSDT